MQVGAYFELLHLPMEAIEAIRHEMEAFSGKRSASCANTNAKVLAAARFTCGGKSIRHLYRPSHFAALIWEHGLEYKEKPVIRIILAEKEATDHFQVVWFKEFSDPDNKKDARPSPHQWLCTSI
jgi:hypothetical protein